MEAIVDVRAQRVQRHATVGVALGARHLRAAEATRDLHLDALGTGSHRAGERTLHRATEGDAVLKLLGDRLCDQACVELGALDLEDVDLDLLARDPVQVAAQLVDLRAGLADHDPRSGRVNVDLDLGRVLADRDVGQTRVREPPDDVITDLQVLVQVVRERPLVEPVRLPVVDVAHADRLGMNFLSHLWLFLRRQQDRQVAGAFADLGRASHRARPEPLDRRTVVGSDRLHVQVLAYELMVVLGVRDR